MRFHRTLEKGQINEWKGFYIPYHELKAYMKQDRVLFVTKVAESLKLVNDFYLKIERIMVSEKDKICTKLKNDTTKKKRKRHSKDDTTAVRRGRFDILNLFRWKDRYSYHKDETNLKVWIRACERMKKYVNLNFTGFRKILKKYDKLYKDTLSTTLLEEVKESYFYRSTRIDKALSELKELYKVHFAQNDKRKAKNVFENITKKDRTDQVSSFVSGMFLAFSLFALHVMEIREGPEFRFVVHMNLIFYGLCLFGLCLILFKRVYINYKFILDLEVATSGSIGSYFLLISSFMLITNVGLYIQKRLCTVNCLLLIACNFTVLLFPFNVLSRASRFFFIKTALKMLATPLFPIQFRHFFLADCLLSFMPCVVGIFEMDPYLALALSTLPALIRILQCIRRSREDKMLKLQLLNALKYTITITFCITKLLKHQKTIPCGTYIWLLTGLLSTGFSSAWDLLVDWEIQRTDRIFPTACVVPIVLLNVFTRLMWLLGPSQFILGFEVTRRFTWFLLRTECEHLNNRDDLKALTGFNLKLSDMFYKVDEETESVVSEDEKIDDSVL